MNSQNPYAILAKFKFHPGQSFFWTDAANQLERVESLRGPGAADIYRDRVTLKELTNDQFQSLQRRINDQLHQYFSKNSGSTMSQAVNHVQMETMTDIVIERVSIPGDDVPENIPPERAAEYQRILQSQRKAAWILIRGRRPLDAKQSVLWLVQRNKTFNGPLKEEIVKVIHQAAHESDLRFFKRLADCLESKQTLRPIDWREPVDRDQFLIGIWCGRGFLPPQLDLRLPPLCFFEGKARAEFCALLMNRRSDSRLNDAVRQAVNRLGLVRPKEPKIRSVIAEGDIIRFV